MMDIKTLEEKTYHLWLGKVASWDGIEIHDDPQTEAFYEMIATTYGDLTDLKTWETAWLDFEAESWGDPENSILSDPQFMVEYYMIRGAERFGYAYLIPELLKRLVTMPPMVKAIASGFAEIVKYGYGYGATEAEVKHLFNQIQEAQNGVSENGCVASKFPRSLGSPETSGDRSRRKEATPAGAH